MHSDPYRVIVVVDRDFGDKLIELPRGVPVWIVDSEVNRRTAEKVWEAFPEPSHLYGVTIFKSPPSSSGEEMFIGELDTIDLHHGIYSANPPYSVLEVIGVAVTERIRSGLEQNGFAIADPTESGFRTVSIQDTTKEANFLRE